MRVSCILMTYGRPPEHQWLVEEAIESFRRQDYPDRELIVLNDCPAQHLSCDLPGVTVINVPRRFRTLGEKRNAAIALSDGDALMPWDDDDIMLPWRISTSVERLASADYFNPSQFWLADSTGLHHDRCRSLAHGCSVFTRRAFDAVGGYPHISFGEDAAFDDALRSTPGIAVSQAAELTVGKWYYIYRWGVSPVHLSSRGPDEAGYDEIGRRAVEPGRYVLRPGWHEDYLISTRNALPSTVRHAERGEQ